MTAKKPVYAKGTTVTADRSRGEIEALLNRYGAAAFAYMRQGDDYLIAFELHARRYKLALKFPKRSDFKDHYAGNGHRVSGEKDYQQATNERWRILVLWLKALLVVVDAKLVTLDQAMQAFLLLPDGRNVHEWLAPQVARIYADGQVPQLMPGTATNGVREL